METPDTKTLAYDGKPVIKLSQNERDSALWKKIRAAVQQRISELRISNDFPLNELDTARLRGKLSAMKEFLDTGTVPLPENDADSPEDGYSL